MYPALDQALLTVSLRSKQGPRGLIYYSSKPQSQSFIFYTARTQLDSNSRFIRNLLFSIEFIEILKARAFIVTAKPLLNGARHS